MKQPIRLLLTTLFILFLEFNSQSQNSPGEYTDFDHGYYFNYYHKYDSALLMFNRYVNNSTDDILKKGMAYNYMGEIQWRTGDLYGAEESLTGAISTLNPLNKKHYEPIAYTYNLLGNINLDLNLYNEAIEFYDKAIFFAKGTDYALEVMNGKATAFQREKNYTAAIAIYDSILSLKPAVGLIARAIDNKARTKWLQDSNYEALPKFQSALKIRVDSQYNDGLIASYAHLSDYYRRSKPDSALWYAQKLHEQAKKNQSPDDILEGIDRLIRLNNSPASKEQWFEQYKRINDSVRMARDTNRSRFAYIKYDFQKSKSDNLILQQHINKQRIATVVIIVIAIALITALLIWFRRRRQKIKQDSENAIRESKLKTSQKVHDVVANGLYKIMNELEHNINIDKEPLLDKIEGLYEKSRDISYEHSPGDDAEYDKQIHLLLTSFANDHTKVIIVGNQPVFWNKVSLTQKHELRFVLEELMINMQKHSRAKNVVIHFKEENNKGNINYKDDGHGFTPGIKFGNGLNNTVSRIKSLDGQINFGKSGEQGLSITINFPLQPFNHDR